MLKSALMKSALMKSALMESALMETASTLTNLSDHETTQTARFDGFRLLYSKAVSRYMVRCIYMLVKTMSVQEQISHLDPTREPVEKRA